jgi:hypothetical protein
MNDAVASFRSKYTGQTSQTPETAYLREEAS